MSELPPGWVSLALGDVALLQGGATPKGVLTAATGMDIPFYKVSDMNLGDGTYMTDAKIILSNESAADLSLRIFPPRSVIFPKVGGALHTNKKRVLTRSAAIDTNTMAAVPGDALVPNYLYYWLSNITLADFAYGAPVPQVSRSRLSAEPFPLPPKAEQLRIVAAIEEMLSRLGAGMAALDRVRQKLRRMRGAVLEAAISNKLVPDNGDTSRWPTVSVGAVASVSGGITKNPKRAPGENAIPFLRVANVPRNGLDLRDVHNIEVFEGELERLRLKKGDLLVVEGNGSPDQIGRSALWDGSIDPCVHQNHLIRVRPGDSIDPEYLNIFWNAPSSMLTIQAAASSTSGLHTLSTGKVRGIAIALPPISLQKQIVNEVSRQLGFIDNAEAALEVNSLKGQSLRKSILTAAFSGALVPQDLSDEPADALLKQLATKSTPGSRPNRRSARTNQRKTQ